MVTFPPGLSAQAFPFTLACPGQDIHRCFWTWMLNIDTGVQFYFSLIYRKLIKSVRIWHVWSDRHLLRQSSGGRMWPFPPPLSSWRLKPYRLHCLCATPCLTVKPHPDRLLVTAWAVCVHYEILRVCWVVFFLLMWSLISDRQMRKWCLWVPSDFLCDSGWGVFVCGWYVVSVFSASGGFSKSPRVSPFPHLPL